MRNKTPFISNSDEWLPMLGFDWALNWSLQPFSIAPVCNDTFGYKPNPLSVKEGGGPSESAFAWLQLNQNKDRLRAKYELFEKTGQKQVTDFQHLHQWHLSEQIFTVYCNYQYLLRKTIQMLTGKTAFPYRSYQRRLTISLSRCCTVWQQSARCCRDTGEVTIPASEWFCSVLCLTLVNSSFVFLKGLIHCSLMSPEWLLLTSVGIALVHSWTAWKAEWWETNERTVMLDQQCSSIPSENQNDRTKAFLHFLLK